MAENQPDKDNPGTKMSDEFGVLLIDKPAGITSFDVIRKLKRITGIKKIGHTGTLDPFATGLLPICIGKATRFAQYIVSEEKHYQATMQFGIQTDTGDNTGEHISTSNLPELNETKLNELSNYVLNLDSQVPPKYSAIKINGRKAYEMARKGEEFTIPARAIKVLEFSVGEVNLPEMQYSALVSKGTYIRVLSEDIAAYLGCVATTIALRRLSIGKLQVKDAVEIRDLTPENWRDSMLALQDVLPFPIVTIDSSNRDTISHGMPVEIEQEDCEQVIVEDQNRNMLCFAKIEEGVIKPKIVMI